MLVFGWTTLLITVTGFSLNHVTCAHAHGGDNSTKMENGTVAHPSHSGDNSTKMENGTVAHPSLHRLLSLIYKQRDTIVAFLVGAVFSATICCLTKCCRRCKKRNCRSLAEPLEMVACQNQQAERVAAEEQEEGGKAPGEGGGSGGDQSSNHAAEAREVDYAKINYSLLQGRSGPMLETEPDPSQADYAEIKPERRDSRGGEREILTEEGERVNPGEVEVEEEGKDPSQY